MLYFRIFNLLEGSGCEAFAAPFDVYLPEDTNQVFDTIDTIVQPDISVICDSKKIIEKGCLGAPDLIVEILSPSTGKKDLNEKFRLYEKRGVKEYWVVDPGNKYVEVFHLLTQGPDAGKYDDGTLTPPVDWRDKNRMAESRVLQGFSIDVDELFGGPPSRNS